MKSVPHVCRTDVFCCSCFIFASYCWGCYLLFQTAFVLPHGQCKEVLLLQSQQWSLLHLHTLLLLDWLLNILSLTSSKGPIQTSVDHFISDSCICILWCLLNHDFDFIFLFSGIEYVIHLWFGIWKWNIIVVYNSGRSYLIIILWYFLLSPLISCEVYIK